MRFIIYYIKYRLFQAAKVQQKMHICKKITRKFTFECDFVGNGLHYATVLSRWASEQSERSHQGSRKARGFVGRGETAANQMSKANFFFASRFRRGVLEGTNGRLMRGRSPHCTKNTVESLLIVAIFFHKPLSGG